MANDNLPTDLAEAFKELEAALIGNTELLDERGKLLTDEQRAIKKRQAEIDAAIQKSVTKWKNAGNAGNRLARSMTSPEGAFSTLGDITAGVVKGISGLLGKIPYVGGALQGLGEAGAETIKFLTAETGKAFSTFNKLSSSGVVSAFQDMRDAQITTGLTFDQLDSVLGKNSESLALLSGSAISGSKSMRGILEANKEFATNMQKFGINFQEYSEIQAGYIAKEARLGFTRDKNDRELAAEARAYTEQLAIVTKLTGKSREQLQKERDQLMSSVRFRAKQAEFVAQGNKPLADRFEEALLRLGPESKEAMQDIIAANGEITTKAAAAYAATMAQGGVDVRQLAKSLMTGQTSVDGFVTTLNTGAKGAVDKIAPLAQIIGPDSILTKNFVEFADMAGYAGRDIEANRKEIERSQEEQKQLPDAAASAARTAQDIASQMQNLATNTQTLAGINDRMGQAVDGLITTINSITGATSASGVIQKPAIGGSTSNLSNNATATPSTSSTRGSVAAPIGYPKTANSIGGTRSTNPFSTPDSAVGGSSVGTSFISIPGAARGALVPPTPGGTLVRVAEAGKPEAIVPMPDGRTIPVIIKNSGEQFGTVGKMLDGLSDKMETVISLLSKGAKYNRNIAQNII